jgi:sugar-phosphatase
MDSVMVTATHKHPVETDVTGVPDYDDLRAIRTGEGLLRLQRTRS